MKILDDLRPEEKAAIEAEQAWENFLFEKKKDIPGLLTIAYWQKQVPGKNGAIATKMMVDWINREKSHFLKRHKKESPGAIVIKEISVNGGTQITYETLPTRGPVKRFFDQISKVIL